MNNFFIKSGYTFFRSMLTIDSIIEFAKKQNLNKIALIDTNVMFGAFEFAKKALKENITPVIGLEIQPLNKIIISKNFLGYKKICQISSLLNCQNPNENLDQINSLIKDNNLIIIENIDNFKFASFVKPTDIITFKLFLKIDSSKNSNLNLDNFLSLENQIEDFPLEQQKILNELNQIDFTFNIENSTYNQVLNFFENANDILKQKLEQKFKDFIKQNKIQNPSIYKDRLLYEFKVISEMDFSNYFLIVEDYVNWANQNNITIGPGRGSAPGSFISYLLNLTKVDPIETNLIFERFLNPSRVSIPDIDIDFQDDKREQVMKYIFSKYSPKNVSQIITFQTFQMKNTIKDFSRLYNISFELVNNFTKLLIDRLTLEQNLRKKEIKEFIQKNIIFQEIIEHVKKIVNLPRQTSIHAAGILISSIDLINLIPTIETPNKTLVSQYSMNHLEEQGLIKFDLLGLRNLSTLNQIFSFIKITKKKDLRLLTNNLNDKKVFELLNEQKTLGVFQLESVGMKNSLKKVKIENFENLVSVISLFRPGPQKNIDLFAERKNENKNIDYFDESLKTILKETFGIIVYQEQILEIAKIFSGFSYSEADNLRRAISKKNIQEMEDSREKFINGAIKNNKSKEIAIKIYDLIVEFANYGFNRSHAYSYAIISYNFAFLKLYYPLEFFAAYLSSIEKDTKKLLEFKIEQKENKNLKLLLPNINNSFSHFSLEKGGIRFGFNSVSGLGIEAINKIIETKKQYKKFTNIYETLIALNLNGLTNNALKLLIKVGSFDDFNFTREGLLNSLDKIISLSKLVLTKDGIIDITILEEDELPKIENIKDSKNLEYELKLLGINLD